MKKFAVVVGTCCLFTAAHVAAQEMDTETDPNAPTIYSRVGMSVGVGGGLSGFIDADMRNYANLGGQWEARVVAGTREMIGAEVAYTGTTSNVDALGLDDSARLLATGLEASGRIHFMNTEWQPYALIGVGWRRYDLTNTDQNTSNLKDTDNVVEIPLGIGVSYRYRGLVVDGRFVARPSFDNDLVQTASIADDDDSAAVDLHNWGLTVMGGWEF
jgi:opacity protein-like surface antigen